MRDKERFGTIVVSLRHKVPHVGMFYWGLPPHYVAVLDAAERAESALGVGSVHFERFYYTGPLRFWAEYSSGGERVFIDLLYSTELSPEEFSRISALTEEDRGRSLRKPAIQESLRKMSLSIIR